MGASLNILGWETDNPKVFGSNVARCCIGTAPDTLVTDQTRGDAARTR